MINATVTKGRFDFSGYRWGNPQVVRKRAQQNYRRMIRNLKTHHSIEDWAAVKHEAQQRRQIFSNALVVMHGRRVHGATNVYRSEKIQSFAKIGNARSTHYNTRSLDIDLGLNQYTFFSFRHYAEFGKVTFVFSNRLLKHPDFFVTAHDICGYIDMYIYDSIISELPKGTHPLSSSSQLKEKIDLFMQSIIPGNKYLDLLSLLSVLEFYTFEDSVKMLLRGATHDGNYKVKTMGVKCGCHSEHLIAEHFHGAEGKMFGETDLSLVEEIIVNHPRTKEKLIARGLPADLIIVIRNITDAYEERFRLNINRFAKVGKPMIRGMTRWDTIQK